MSGYLGNKTPSVVIEESPEPIYYDASRPPDVVVNSPRVEPAIQAALEVGGDVSNQLVDMENRGAQRDAQLGQQYRLNTYRTNNVARQVQGVQKQQALKTLAELGNAGSRGAEEGKNFSGGRVDAGKVVRLVADFYTMGGYGMAQDAAKGANSIGDLAKSSPFSKNTGGSPQALGGSTQTVPNGASGAALTSNASQLTQPLPGGMNGSAQSIASSANGAAKAEGAAQAAGGKGGGAGPLGMIMGLFGAVKRDESSPRSPLIL